MSANWYDLLGVDRNSSSDEIRVAWKSSIDDLDPTDHRFGLYNKAAGVLLDADKRAAYDDELGPEEPELDESDDGPVADEPDEAQAADDSSNQTDDEPVTGSSASGESATDAAATRFDPPVWLLALLLVATLAAAGGAFFLHRTSSDPDQVESDISAARTAAEQAVPKVLTYDYRYPERDHDAAMQVLTGKVATSYDKIWNDAILPNLVKVKGAALTKVIGSGVVRASDDGDQVELVVVLSSKTTNKNTSTTLPPIPMTVKMVDKGGSWLIQDMDLWQPASADEGSSPAPEQESEEKSGKKPGGN